ALLDAIDDRLIELHLQTERLRQRLARQIVFGGTEAAAGDEEVRAVDAVADLAGEIVEPIADHALARQRDAEVLERRCDLERVRVDARRPEHFRADGDDRCACHRKRRISGWEAPRKSRSFAVFASQDDTAISSRSRDSASHFLYSRSIIALRSVFCVWIFFMRSPSR